jgi:hypothetical protein
MPHPTIRSTTSLKVALSLGFLAMTLCGPALAADGKDASRGAKGDVVRQRPDHATLPVNARTGVEDKKPSSSWSDAFMRLALALREGIRF